MAVQAGLLAFLGSSQAAQAQRSEASAADATAQAIAGEIAEIEWLQGVNSPDLIAPLTALGLLYEERGDADDALAIIERATQVIEVNRGLHTLDEAQLLRQTIRIERARGNAEAAWNKELELLTLIRRHPNDARTVPMLREIADARRAVLARYRAGEFPKEILLGCYYNEARVSAEGRQPRGCGSSGSRRTVIDGLDKEAAGYSREAREIELRLERWAQSSCAQPEAQALAAGRRSKRHAEEELREYLSELSDYAGCAQLKYEQAADASASAQELARLLSSRNAAAAELARQTAIYQERFGSIRTASVSCVRPLYGLPRC